MATRCGLILLLLSFGALADTAEERALMLNQEMDFLMSVAAKPRVWGKGSLPAQDKRSGPAPTQMKGIENLEERYFSDEVSLQAAQAQRDASPEEDETQDVIDTERVDGTPPKTLRRKR